MQGTTYPSGLTNIHAHSHIDRTAYVINLGLRVLLKDTSKWTSGAGDRTTDHLIQGRPCSTTEPQSHHVCNFTDLLCKNMHYNSTGSSFMIKWIMFNIILIFQ